MSQTAYHAITAAKHRKQWGRYAARRYALKRGVSMRLYRLACQLEAMDKAGV